MESDVTGYLANQLAFSETGLWILNNLIKPRLKIIGIKIYDPFIECSKELNLSKINTLKLYKERITHFRIFSEKITPINNKLMQKSDCLIAILDGGPAIDDGVASEIGYYVGIKRGPIFALRSDIRCGENISVSINPQVLGYIAQSKGKIYEPPNAIEKWFKGIEAFKNKF